MESSQVDDVNISLTSSTSQISSSQNSESKNIAQTIGTPDDHKAYRSNQVRKTSSLVQKCIAKGIKFPKYVVDLSRAFLTDPDSMELNKIEILNMRCTNAMNQDHSSSDSDKNTNKSGKVLKYKRRPIAPVPPPVTQSATVYPPSQSWPGSQLPYYGYDQAGYKYPAPHIPSQQLNQVNQPFNTGFKFQEFATSTLRSYQQTGANRPAPPPPFIPTNVTPPTEFPTDLSGFQNIQGSCDPNARSAMQAQPSQKAKSIQVTTHYLNVNFKW